jgi:NhaA family Na+:H+ antiporter
MKIRLTRLFKEFLESEQASGAVLILCIIASVTLANSPIGVNFSGLLHTRTGLESGGFHLSFSIERWINDGLMAVFFLLIGLEIRRELYIGELSDIKNATLPVFAAIGGMVTPALLHYLFNHGTETQSGFGIPVATDIAFTLGVLALLGKRVPVSLKVFVAALAIIDDLGAIIVIALFYAGEFSLMNLGLCLGIFAGLLILNRLGVRRLFFYIVPGLVMWYFMLKSGIHPTMAGVLLAFAIPFARGSEGSPSYRLEHALQRPVAFLIMPLFAFANTGIALGGSWYQSLATPNSMGIFAGLCIGKPIGITLFSLLAIGLGLSRLPDDVSWKRLIGAGFLCGIGFTMSVFITLLAFGNPEVIQSSKVAILLSSLLAGTTGYIILRKNSA